MTTQNRWKKFFGLLREKVQYDSEFDKVIAETEEYEAHRDPETHVHNRHWGRVVARLRKWANNTPEPKLMDADGKHFNKDWLVWKYWISWPVDKAWVLERARSEELELQYIKHCVQRYKGVPEPRDPYTNGGLDYVDWYMGNFPDPKLSGLDRIQHIKGKLQQRAREVEYEEYLQKKHSKDEPPLMVMNPDWITWYQRAHPKASPRDALEAFQKAKLAQQQKGESDGS